MQLDDFHYLTPQQISIWIDAQVEAGIRIAQRDLRWLTLDMLFDDQDGRCAACDAVFGAISSFDLDHKIARGNGGTDRISNLQLLCVPCHRAKTKIDLGIQGGMNQ